MASYWRDGVWYAGRPPIQLEEEAWDALQAARLAKWEATPEGRPGLELPRP